MRVVRAGVPCASAARNAAPAPPITRATATAAAATALLWFHTIIRIAPFANAFEVADAARAPTDAAAHAAALACATPAVSPAAVTNRPARPVGAILVGHA